MPLYEGIGLINEKYPVVLDIGTRFTKAGFAGETSPRCIVRSRVRNKDAGVGWKNLRDCEDPSELYQLLVEFLQFLYCRHLLVTPKDRKVVIVESVFCKTEWREILARVLYFHYEVLNVLWLPSQLAAVSVTGWDTGLVIDVGLEETSVIPVYKGVTILKAAQVHALGSVVFDRGLKDSLVENCTNSKVNLTELLTEEKLEDIRVRSCFVTLPGTNRTAKPFRFEISGDHFLEFNGKAREKAAEIWFQNQDLDGESIPQMVLESLSKCPLDTRKKLAKSIVVTGGACMLPGFKRRLLHDLNRITENQSQEVMDPIEYGIFELPAKENCAAWLGGAIYGATEAMTIRGFSKEHFLKTGVVPDWSNLAYNSYKGFSSGSNTPAGSPSKSL